MTTKEFQQKSALQIFLSYFKPHKKLFIMDLSCALAISIIDLAFPYVSRWCMYELLPKSAYQTFFAVMVVVFAAFALRALLTYVICYWGLRHLGGGGYPPGPVSPYAGALLRLL